MARNTLSDLNNHLFEQMERLNNDDLTEEELEKEMNRAKSMTSVAHNIVANANLILRANELKREYGENTDTPNLLV